jgi:hypothetical protein
LWISRADDAHSGQWNAIRGATPQRTRAAIAHNRCLAPAGAGSAPMMMSGSIARVPLAASLRVRGHPRGRFPHGGWGCGQSGRTGLKR